MLYKAAPRTPILKLSLEKAIRVGFGLALIILTAIAVLSYRSARGLIETANSMAHTHEVIDQLDNLLAQVLEAESATRDYVLSGQEVYLEPYQAAAKEIDRTIAGLSKLTADNPVQQRLLSSLKVPIAEKLARCREEIRLRRDKGREATSEVFLTGRGHELMDGIRDLIVQMKSEEKRLLRQRSDRARGDAEASILSLLIGSLLSFAILFTVFYHLDREIVRRRQAQEEIRELNQDLKRRIGERTAELAAVNQELEQGNQELAQASRLKSDFLASMSHELRTPLNAIAGFSDLLAEESAGPLSEKQKRFVGHVQKGARHLLEVVNDVLDLSKIEAGHVELHPRPLQ